MKKMAFLFSALTLSSLAFAGNKVIFGTDDRLDVYQVRNPLHKKLALSTAGMIPKVALHPGKDSKHIDIKYAFTLAQGMNICSEEKFSQQKMAPSCSGFLVAPDILVTAGHCLQGKETPSEICQKTTWVFGYEQKSAHDDPTKNIKLSDVYQCQDVLFQRLDDSYDYAIIRLDRKVRHRPVLPIRRSGKITANTPLVIIGHPLGLPTKIAAGGRVTYNSDQTRFSANLDSFKGNSGSAVINATTGVVEGILVMGKSSLIRKDESDINSCRVINRCDQNSQNCMVNDDDARFNKGQISMRMTAILDELLKAID